MSEEKKVTNIEGFDLEKEIIKNQKIEKVLKEQYNIIQ